MDEFPVGVGNHGGDDEKKQHENGDDGGSVHTL